MKTWLRVGGQTLGLTIAGAAMLFVSCDRPPLISDSSTIVVQPGRGVTNLCEIGMTVKQVRKALHDGSIHKLYDGSLTWKRLTDSPFVLVASLGAIGVVEVNGQISHLEFHVEPDTNPAIRGLVVRNPFRGKVGDRLSFNSGTVTRNEVEAEFGALPRGSTNSSDYAALSLARKPFWLLNADGNGEIRYADRGLVFYLKSNVVTSFQVYWP